MTPIQASLKKNEVFVYRNLLDERKIIQLKFKNQDLVRVADSKKTFSKRGSTNWSYKFHKVTKVLIDTIPSYKIDNL